jgi:hypothetical protein
MKRNHRGRPLPLEEDFLTKAIRSHVIDEVPDLIAQHEERMALGDTDSSRSVEEFGTIDLKAPGRE